jgi:hypothetical protein
MDKRVYKYELNPMTSIQEVILPIESQILTAQMQGNKLQLWALVDSIQELKAKRVIEIIGTGYKFCSPNGVERKHISTIQLAGGVFVYHIFENL